MNKDIEYYMSLPYHMEIYPDTEEGGYTVCYPDLPGCLTCSETLDGAILNARDALQVWIESMLESGQPIPEPASNGHYSGQFKLRIPKSLHRDLARHASAEGISMNQYCLYLLSMNDVRYSQHVSSSTKAMA